MTAGNQFMSKLGEQPAFPVSNDANVNGDKGMTLRQYYAGLTLQGIAANDNLVQTCIEYAVERKTTPEKVMAHRAVEMANALLERLELP